MTSPKTSRSRVPDATSAGPGVRALRRSVASLRRRAWRLLVARRVAVFILLCAAGVVAGGLLDFAFRAPGWLRFAGLIGALVLAGVFAARTIAPAVRFRPTLSQFAFHLERAWSARAGQPTRGMLTSALELDRDAAPRNELEAELRRSVIDAAQSRFAARTLGGLLNPYPARRALGAAGLASIALALGSLIWPGVFATAAARMLLPWTDASWPKRVPLVNATEPGPHPSDVAVAFRATAPGDRNGLDLWFRVLGPDGPGPTTRATLMPQRRGDDTARLHERLVEPSLLADRGVDLGRASEIEYWFVSSDDRTPTERLRLVPPPEIERLVVSVTPPAYADGLAHAFAAGTADAGQGVDERSVIGPVLAGSRVEVTLETTEPVTQPDAWADPLRAALRDGSASQTDTTERSASVAGVIERRADVVLDFTSRDGIAMREPGSLTLDVVPDERPSIAITDPPIDEGVLATAVIGLTARATDDIGLERFALEIAVERGDPQRPGSTPVREETPFDLLDVPFDTPAMAPEINQPLDLASLESQGGLQRPLAPGDVLVITAIGNERYLDANGTQREPTRSSERRLVILSEADLVDEIRAELNTVRTAAWALDERQAELSRQRTEAGEPVQAAAELGRMQERLTQRLQGQSRRVDRLSGQIDRNRLENDSLRGLLDEAASLTQSASDASERAQAALDDVASVPRDAESPNDSNAQPASEAEPDPQTRADDAQRDVRDRLGELLELLDRGEDGFLARRSVERLLDEQRGLAQDTAEATAGLIGRDSDELSAREQSDLDRIAARQRELADEAERAIDELEERAAEMALSDPAQSGALADAAQRAREQGLVEQLREAAESVQQNQSGRASQSQQDAIESLEEILEELDNTAERRAEELQRQLADLADLIRSLRDRQQREIAALEQVTSRPFDRPQLVALGERMIGLARATASAGARASEELGAPGRAVVEPLTQAAEYQGFAVQRLRDTDEPPDVTSTDAAGLHTRSLIALERALEEAERLLEESEQDAQSRALEELVRGFREALAEQVGLNTATDPYVDRRLARRERAEVRALGTRQLDLGDRTGDLSATATELGRLGMIEFAAELLAESIDRAGRSLERGVATTDVRDEQRTIASLLESLITSLDPARPDADPFADGAGASEGGGGQGGGEGGEQPPSLDLAELMLLRAVQAQAAARTRSAHESGNTDATDRLQRLQRDLADRAIEMLERLEQDGPRPQPGDAPPADDTQQPADPPSDPTNEPPNDPPSDPPSDLAPGEGTE